MTNDHTNNVNIKRLIDMLRVTGKNYDVEKITRAAEYAAMLHEGQYRVSGEPSGNLSNGTIFFATDSRAVLNSS